MTDKAPERIAKDCRTAAKCLADAGSFETGQSIFLESATALEAAQARIAEMEADKRTSLLGVIAMALSCGGELRVNPKARQSCQQYSLHTHDDPAGDLVLSVRALKEKPNG